MEERIGAYRMLVANLKTGNHFEGAGKYRKII